MLLGHNLNAAAADAARFGEVLCVDDPALATCSADTWAPAIARAVEQEQADMILAGSGTFAKDILTRAAGLLGGTMASDVLSHRWIEDGVQFLSDVLLLLLGDVQVLKHARRRHLYSKR